MVCHLILILIILTQSGVFCEIYQGFFSGGWRCLNQNGHKGWEGGGGMEKSTGDKLCSFGSRCNLCFLLFSFLQGPCSYRSLSSEAEPSGGILTAEFHIRGTARMHAATPPTDHVFRPIQNL